MMAVQEEDWGGATEYQGTVMTAEWKRVRLDELTEVDSPITYGVVKPGDPGDVLFIRGGDLAGGRVLNKQLRTITRKVSTQYRRTLLRGGELLICLVGQPGQVAVAPAALAGANIARQVGLIRLRSEVDAEFIRYFLQSPDGQASLGTYTGGSVQQVINLGDLRTVNVPFPPLSEQQRIVDILDNAFDGIATAKAIAEKNLQNARALFESHLQSVFNGHGDGWVKKRLGEVCQIKPPKAEARRRFSNTDLVSFVPMEDLGIDLKTFVPTQAKPFAEVSGSYTYFAEGDVLLAKITPCFENGKLGVAANLTNGIGFGSSEYIVFRPYPSVNKEWLYYFLLRDAFRKEGAKRMSGAVGHKRVPKEFIDEYPIPVPPLPEQQHIVEQLDSFSAETQRLESIYQQKLATLDELKKSLLHQAFIGALSAIPCTSYISPI